MLYSSSISNSIDVFITDKQTGFNTAGYTLSHPSTNVLRITKNTAGTFTPYIHTVSGTLNGSASAYQVGIDPVARIDTITLSGTGGYAGIVCDAVTRFLYFDFDLTTTAFDFVSAYASAYTLGGVTVTSSGNDIIFTSSTPGIDFTGSTTITNVANTYLGRIKIEGNEIWEDSLDSDSSSFLMVNRRGYKGQLSRNRHFFIGNGIGGILAQFLGMSGTDAPGSVILAGNWLQLNNVPTSSTGLATGRVWRDGATLKIVT